MSIVPEHRLFAEDLLKVLPASFMNAAKDVDGFTFPTITVPAAQNDDLVGAFGPVAGKASGSLIDVWNDSDVHGEYETLSYEYEGPRNLESRLESIILKLNNPKYEEEGQRLLDNLLFKTKGTYLEDMLTELLVEKGILEPEELRKDEELEISYNFGLSPGI